jgi:hypothetical protein
MQYVMISIIGKEKAGQGGFGVSDWDRVWMQFLISLSLLEQTGKESEPGRCVGMNIPDKGNS